EVVEPEPHRNLVTLDGGRPPRKPDERLGAPAAHVEPFPVLRDLDAVRARRLAARHDLPADLRVPLPQLAVSFPGPDAVNPRGYAARQKIRRREAAFGKGHDGIESDRVRRHGAANPGQ